MLPLSCAGLRAACGFFAGFHGYSAVVGSATWPSHDSEYQRDGCSERTKCVRVPSFLAEASRPCLSAGNSTSTCCWSRRPPALPAKVAGAEIEDTWKNGKQFVKLAVDVQLLAQLTA